MQDDVARKDEPELFIVRTRSTTLSQPAALAVVKVWFPDVKYVEPFHWSESQAVTVSVKELELVIVRSKVTVLSQPAAFVNIWVAVLFEDV